MKIIFMHDQVNDGINRFFIVYLAAYLLMEATLGASKMYMLDIYQIDKGFNKGNIGFVYTL